MMQAIAFPDAWKILAVLLILASAPRPASGQEAGTDGPQEPEQPPDPPALNEWRLDPVEVPETAPPDNDGSPLTVQEILELRETLGVSPAHEEYPLVPGCQPVPGETGELPVPEETHHVGSRAVCLPAQWIDSFFADEDDEFYAARTLIRVIHSGRWQSRGETDTGTRVNARVVLPHTGDRLSLIFRSDDKDDDRLGERDDISEEEQAGPSRVGLRWAAVQTRQLVTHLDFGIRGRDPFVRSRFRWRTELPADIWFRFNQDFYWRGNDDRRGHATELQLEKLLNDSRAIRITTALESNTRMRREQIGWEWSQSAAYFWRIRKRSALQVIVRAQGRSQPQWRTDSYLTSLRFRRSVWRPWLYYELEPFTYWPREEDFRAIPGIIARLEMQIGAYR